MHAVVREIKMLVRWTSVFSTQAVFSTQDFFLIGFLAFLEGILSIDNALVLAMMAKRLPPEQRKKALSYGLGGAIFFRLLALSLATYLIRWTWVKFVGGGYLILVAAKHFLSKAGEENETSTKPAGFWRTVIAIELMDIAFAVDSILAAVALSSKFWVVFTGGFIGVIIMRFAASIFIRLLTRFPAFETTAYLLVLIIGVKLVLQALRLPHLEFESPKNPAFWIFWGSMLSSIVYGIMRKPKPS